MTYKELNNLRYMPYHINRLYRRIEELESGILSRSTSVVRITSGQTYRGIEPAQSLVECRAALEEMQADYERRKREAEEYIYSLDDEYIKAILIARFVERRTWKRTAMEIGGDNTANGVRMACVRFFKKK